MGNHESEEEMGNHESYINNNIMLPIALLRELRPRQLHKASICKFRWTTLFSGVRFSTMLPDFHKRFKIFLQQHPLHFLQ